jgi:molecular chaperone GrpE
MATKRNTDQEQDEDKNQAGAPGNHAPVENAPGSAQAADPRLQELASQLEEVQARYLRLAADFENYKKRARQEQMDTVQYAAAALAERLLPVLDDVKRALDHAPEGADEGWLRGVRLTFQHLEEALASVGVEPIETVGRPFDPKLDEAIGSEESDEHPDDTVLVELRRGYRMHDRVLRPALVKVSRRPAQDS